tara:strand:+ start:2142 stop:2495 length:354 start_codon:yes stop_codon:yes gene_type:complete
MSTISKELLSGSTNGMPISLTTSVTSGAVTIHTAVSGTTDIDEVWLWAVNIHTAAITLTLEVGTTDEDQHIKAVIQPNESVLVCPGLALQNAKVIKGFASTANVCNIFGYANRLDVS